MHGHGSRGGRSGLLPGLRALTDPPLPERSPTTSLPTAGTRQVAERRAVRAMMRNSQTTLPGTAALEYLRLGRPRATVTIAGTNVRRVQRGHRPGRRYPVGDHDPRRYAPRHYTRLHALSSHMNPCLREPHDGHGRARWRHPGLSLSTRSSVPATEPGSKLGIYLTVRSPPAR